MRVFLLLILLLPTGLFADWTLLRTFNDPVSCGFFVDADHGVIGTHNHYNRGTPQIWRTTDGGTTWTRSTTPTLNDGRLTSIFMKDATIGYATMWMYESPFHLMWKTTDGGRTWFNHSQGNSSSTTCVYATPHSLVLTSWPQIRNFDRGGFSLDDGRTINETFFNGFTEESNGIDFSDDLTGVVTPGPNADFTDEKSPCFFTTDGGRTWAEGGMMSESWGVYGARGTTTFLALPEGNQRDPQTSVVRSTNVGRTWQTVISFPNSFSFTGHIDGVGSTIYVQTDADGTNSGLMRSVDLGTTWKNVGGPTNIRDTRFVVTGCKGEIVYAFDVNGGVWKTDDGGDGTLAIEQVELGDPEPLPDNSLPFMFGDTVRLPVYLHTNSLKLKSFRTRLGMNTDFLEPFDVVTLGTLSDGANVLVTSDLTGGSIEVTFPAERTIVRANTQLPLCYILARVYLTRDTTTDITLDSFMVTETGASPRNILSCLGPDGTSLAFTVNLKCGAPTLYRFIRDEPILDFSFIRPNPNPSGIIEIGVTSHYEGAVSIELVDALGRVIRRIDNQLLTSGENTIRVAAPGISGICYVRMHSPAGSIHSRPILFVQ